MLEHPREVKFNNGKLADFISIVKLNETAKLFIDFQNEYDYIIRI